MASTELPEFRDWSIAAVRLLQGVVYADDERPWNLVLAAQTQLATYFARLGLLLVVDEPEGLAYLRQLTDDEQPAGYEQLPKLYRRTRLGYDETLLAVLLREALRRFEEEEMHDERCVIDAADLFDQWRGLFPAHHDEVRARRELSAALAKLEDLGFTRKFSDEPEAWEIRRILKARLPAAELESLKAQLVRAAGERGRGERARDVDGQ
ncbi:MAG: DUF4194 domain-containing protein [Planctomycetia bacterium]|nr:DUF4194 domain-containing protein [Planctomycetia bacterium]